MFVFPCLLLFSQLQSLFSSSVYNVVTVKQNYSPNYSWEEVQVTIIDEIQHKSFVFQQQVPSPKEPQQYNVSEVTSTQVFVSLTTISSRVQSVNNSIITILHGVLVPTRIFLFLSRSPFLIDQGIPILPDNLLCLVAQDKLTIVYTENTGPHRKLLPLLSRFYSSGEDVAIVNIDDDMQYLSGSGLLYQLVAEDLRHNGTAVVALRARRIGLCEQTSVESNSTFESTALISSNQSDHSSSSSMQSGHHQFTKYSGWGLTSSYGRNEMLVLPTGTGGVLYRPEHFHPVVFDEDLRAVTGTGDDLMFRLACMANGVTVATGCRESEGRVAGGRRRCRVDVEQMARRYRQRLSGGAGGEVEILEDQPQTQGQVEQVEVSESYLFEVNNTLQLDDTRSGEGLLPVEPDHHEHEREESSFSSDQQNVVVEEYFRTTRNLRGGSGGVGQGQISSTKQQSLYAINRKGRNDEQWNNAIAYLEQLGVIPSFKDLVRENYSEREESCYAAGKKKNRAVCSLYVCMGRNNNGTSSENK